MISFSKKHKKYILASIVILLMFSFSSIKPQKVSANGSLTGIDPLEVIRDMPLKAIAWKAKQLAIAMITDSIVNWINSGFKGDPTFISNPESFFLDIANEVTGKFIDELGAGFLCEPFSLQIQLALATPNIFIDRAKCTVLDVVDNYDAFMNDFSQGGWAGWISVTQNPQNNPYGAYLMAKSELDKKLAEKIGFQKDEVNQGSGFLTLKKCVDETNNDDAAESSCTESYNSCTDASATEAGDQICVQDLERCMSNVKKKCNRYENQTPGKVLVGQLSGVLGSSVKQLEVTDQFTEAMIAIADAVINQMVQKGVRSMTSTSSGTPKGTWYSDSMEQDKIDLIAEIKKDIENVGARSGAVNGDIMSTIKNTLACYGEQITTIEKSNFTPPNMFAVPTKGEIGDKIKILKDKEETVQGILDEINANDNISEITRWFEWGGSLTEINKGTPKLKQSVSSPFNYTLFSLKPLTTYYFRAVVEKDKEIFYGDILNFISSTTGKNQPTPTPTPPSIPSTHPSQYITTDPATELTNFSAKLNGEANPGEGVNSENSLGDMITRLEKDDPPITLPEFSDIVQEYKALKGKGADDPTSGFSKEKIDREVKKINDEWKACSKDLQRLNGWNGEGGGSSGGDGGGSGGGNNGGDGGGSGGDGGGNTNNPNSDTCIEYSFPTYYYPYIDEYAYGECLTRGRTEAKNKNYTIKTVKSCTMAMRDFVIAGETHQAVWGTFCFSTL